MTTVSTLKAFVVQSSKGIYTEQTRQHPALAHFEQSQAFFDGYMLHKQRAGFYDFYSTGFTVHTPHGDVLQSALDSSHHDTDHVFAKVCDQFYADVLEPQKHFFTHIIALDADFGYDAWWMGNLFGNVKGQSGAVSENKVKDPEGFEWDVEIPLAYHFEFVKDDSTPLGVKMRYMKIFTDRGLVNDALEKRGHGHLKTTNK